MGNTPPSADACRLQALALVSGGASVCEDITHVVHRGRHFVLLGEIHKPGTAGEVRGGSALGRLRGQLPDRPVKLFSEVRPGDQIQVPHGLVSSCPALLEGAPGAISVDTRPNMLLDLLSDLVDPAGGLLDDAPGRVQAGVRSLIHTGVWEALAAAEAAVSAARPRLGDHERAIAETYLAALKRSWSNNPDTSPGGFVELERVVHSSVDASAFAILCARASSRRLNVLHAGAAHTSVIADLFALAGASVSRVRRVEDSSIYRAHRAGAVDRVALEQTRAAVAARG